MPEARRYLQCWIELESLLADTMPQPWKRLPLFIQKYFLADSENTLYALTDMFAPMREYAEKSIATASLEKALLKDVQLLCFLNLLSNCYVPFLTCPYIDVGTPISMSNSGEVPLVKMPRLVRRKRKPAERHTEAIFGSTATFESYADRLQRNQERQQLKDSGICTG